MSTIKNSVAFSSGGKRDLDFGIPERLKSSQIVPGPGNYNKESTFSKTTKHSFSKTERMKGPATISPGPGSYLNTTTDAFQKKGPKFTVSKTVRPKDLFINIREGFQFFSKSTDGLRSEYPGPGRYELDGGNSKLKTRSVIILKSSKDIDYNNKIPGPGAYENDMTRVKSVMPKWTVSKTIREDPFLPENLKKELVTTPGVGNYNFSTSFGKGPKTAVRGKPNINYNNGIPGPGAYNNQLKDNLLKKAPAWGNSKGKARDEENFVNKSSLKIPGPEKAPNVTLFDPKKMKGYKFSKSAKIPETYRPEPGRYDRA